MQALKPTLFIGVPRVFDKVYDGVQARLKLAPLRKRVIFALACWYKWRNIKAGYRWDEVRALFACQALMPESVSLAPYLQRQQPGAFVWQYCELLFGMVRMNAGVPEQWSSLCQCCAAVALAEFPLNWAVLSAQASPLADRMVFSQVKSKLGGNVRLVCSGRCAPAYEHALGGSLYG